ncbi:hypothetical protein [Micromonospora rubida]
MGAPRLSTFVHVVEMVTDDNGKQTPGRSGSFGPDELLPDWAVTAISNPDVWDGDPPPRPKPTAVATKVPAESPADERARLLARLAELGEAGDPDSGGSDGEDNPPPKSGPGSGAPRWREYAARHEVEVPADASREAVVAELDAAGVRTE